MIKSKKVTYKSYKFDSKFELSMYKLIEAIIKANAPNISIGVQFPVLIREKTIHYPAKHWKIDFILAHDDGKCLFVEAKGEPRSHQRLIGDIKHLAVSDLSAHDSLVVVVPNDYKRKKQGTKDTSIRQSLANSIKVPVIYQRDLRKFIVDYFR